MSESFHTIFLERVIKSLAFQEKPDEAFVSEAIETKLAPVFSYLNNWIKNHNTHALVGKHLSVADFAVINHIIDLDAANVKWRDGKYPELEQYVSRMLNKKQISKAIPKEFQI